MILLDDDFVFLTRDLPKENHWNCTCVCVVGRIQMTAKKLWFVCVFVRIFKTVRDFRLWAWLSGPENSKRTRNKAASKLKRNLFVELAQLTWVTVILV